MVSLDIFKQDAFSFISMTSAIEKMPYQPMMLGAMNLFTPKPVSTLTVAIEQRQGKLNLIQTSERGAPPSTQDKIRPTIRDFRTVRLFKQDTLYSHELQGVRAFGTETELQTVQKIVAERQQRLINDLQLTFEYHRMGALSGIVLDADGSTVIRNYFTEFGITPPADISFTNAAVTAAAGMRAFIQTNVVRPMLRAAQVGMTPGLKVNALVGDGFFDWLTNHPDVTATYNNWAAAADLRQGNAFESFYFGGVYWQNYRGTDDNSTVAVGVNKAKFFLEGVPDLFQVAYSPGENFEVVNTMGREYYSMVLPDMLRNAFVEVEVASYPLFICSRPETLLSGTRS